MVNVTIYTIHGSYGWCHTKWMPRLMPRTGRKCGGQVGGRWNDGTRHGDRLDPAFAQGLLDVASINTEVLEIWRMHPSYLFQGSGAWGSVLGIEWPLEVEPGLDEMAHGRCKRDIMPYSPSKMRSGRATYWDGREGMGYILVSRKPLLHRCFDLLAVRTVWKDISDDLGYNWYNYQFHPICWNVHVSISCISCTR